MASPGHSAVFAALALALSSCGARTALDEAEPRVVEAGVDAGRAEDAGGPDTGSPPPPLEERRRAFRIEPARLLDVEARDDGGFLVLYLLDALFNPTGDGAEVRLQLFDAFAEPIGDALTIYRTRRFGPSGDAAFLEDGGFVVAFPVSRGRDITRIDYAVQVLRFTEAGTIWGPELTFEMEWRPTIVGLHDGGFVLTTQRWEDDVSELPLIERFFTLEGAGAGPPREHERGCGQLAVAPQGYAIACDGAVHRFDADGDPVGSPLSPEPFAEDGSLEAFAFWPHARLLVASEAHARTLSADGTPAGAWIDLRRPADAAARPTQLGLARSGCGARRCRFTALWLNDDASDSRPMLRELDADGQPAWEDITLGPPARVEGPRAYYENVDVAGARYGQAVLAWTAVDRPEMGSGIAPSVEGLSIVRN